MRLYEELGLTENTAYAFSLFSAVVFACVFVAVSGWYFAPTAAGVVFFYVVYQLLNAEHEVNDGEAV